MPKLTYTTVQLVRIEDKFLATLHYVLMLVIFVYIIVSQAIRVLALSHLRFEQCLPFTHALKVRVRTP